MSPIVPEVDPYSTNFFLRTTGDGFASPNVNPAAFGAGVGADLLEVGGGPVPYDASRYGGIAFTYSLSTAFYGAQLRLNVGTAATTPAEFGGTCTSGCYDDFGFTFQYAYGGQASVSFSQLAQLGFGTSATFDPKTILMVKWQISFPYPYYYPYPPTTNTFNFTLDDISLLPAAGGSSGAGGFPGGTGGAFGTGGFTGAGGSFGDGGAFGGGTGGRPFPGFGGSGPVASGGVGGGG